MIPPEAGTVVDCFLSHPERVHFTFDHGNGHTREYPGPQLAVEAAGLALHFRRLGVVPGDRVAVVVPTSEPLLRTIVAAWFARAAIVVLPHRLGGARSAASADKLQRMIAKVSPRIVVGYAEVEATVRAALGADQHYLAAEKLGDIDPAAVDDTMRPRPEDLAVLQFSSGSTREPRAVMIRQNQQLLHCDIASRGTRYDSNSIIFNWLPVYHDFALAAGVVFPLASGLKCTMMPTECVVSDPIQWFKSIKRHGATISALTPSSVDLLTARISKLTSDDEYFGLKYVWLAAEPVFPKRLQKSIKLLQPFLNIEEIIRPAYGLAEAVVAVSTTKIESSLRIEKISRESFRTGAITRTTSESDAIEFASCGTIVDTMLVKIVGPDELALKQPARGKILIKGPTVTAGYWGENAPILDDWLDTGDDGFMIDDQLYICGRRKDVIIRGGSNYDCSEIESEAMIAAQEALLPISAIAVLSILDNSIQRERVIVILEKASNALITNESLGKLRADILQRTGLLIDEFTVAPSKLPRTTSGKLQRSVCKNLFSELTQNRPNE